MRVFISWSGQQTRELGHALKSFIDVTFAGHVDSFLSDKDIAPGERFYSIIDAGLGEASLGIILLTQANQREPWILFEAGALAGKTDTGSVIPMLIDLDRTALAPPLSQFQNVSGSLESDIRRLCSRIATVAGAPLGEEAFELLFTNAWPKLQLAISNAKSPTPPADAALQRRDQADVIDEILLGVTALVRASRVNASSFTPQRESTPLRNNGNLKLSPGNRITHADFGDGTVTAVTGDGAKIIAHVDFDAGSRKKLLVKIAPIELIRT